MAWWIVHGSGNPGMSEQDIQIVRAGGQKQAKGLVYGGVLWHQRAGSRTSYAYADMMGGTPTLVTMLKIKPGTRCRTSRGYYPPSESYINEVGESGIWCGSPAPTRARPDRACSYRQKRRSSMAPRGTQSTTSQSRRN